jgi:hypothetical protein
VSILRFSQLDQRSYDSGQSYKSKKYREPRADESEQTDKIGHVFFECSAVRGEVIDRVISPIALEP